MAFPEWSSLFEGHDSPWSLLIKGAFLCYAKRFYLCNIRLSISSAQLHLATVSVRLICTVATCLEFIHFCHSISTRNLYSSYVSSVHSTFQKCSTNCPPIVDTNLQIDDLLTMAEIASQSATNDKSNAITNYSKILK